jgi:hypothetical protein
MNRYDTVLPVHVRIGERREWTVGAVPADHSGRVQPEKLAELFIAVGEHIQVLVDNATRLEREPRNGNREDTSS